MMKKNIFKKLVILNITAIMILSALAVFPLVRGQDWDNHKMHYPQLPDPNGWNVLATYPYVCADDWQCSETGWVKDIHFWGSWYNDWNGYIGGFWISIHEDIPATPTEPSQPGTCLWHEFITDFTETMMEPSLQGWYDPNTGEYYPENHVDWYQYDIILPQNLWFMQTEGTIYWLDISAAPILPGTYWGWKSSNDHWNDDAFFGETFGQYEFLWYDELYEPATSVPKTNWFIGLLDNYGEMVGGDGTDFYDDPSNQWYYYGWYWYENYWFWNMWFYDHPFDPERYKEISIDFYAYPGPADDYGWIEIWVDWSTDLYYYDNYPNSDIVPPLPPLTIDDENDWIGRQLLWAGDILDDTWIEDLFYMIPDYNPEWVSIDVYGWNVWFQGYITHECISHQSLDLSFVITGGPYEEPPETEKTLIGCVYIDDLYHWINSDTQICFTATDDLSGVFYTYIEIWWDQNVNGIEEPGETTVIVIFDNGPDDLDPTIGVITYCMTLPDECYHEIRYYSVDYAGLVENTHIEIDLVDNTPPTITKTHPDPCYYPINLTAGIIKVGDRIILTAQDGGTPPCISGNGVVYWGFELDGTWHPTDITDNYDGNFVGYYKNGKWWYYYSQPIRFQETCKHILEYWAIDNVCNIGPTYSQTYWVNDCQDEVWIDDDFNFDTPGWWHTHFMKKQMALNWLRPWGTAYMDDGIYDEEISIDDVPCCDNTGITQMGEYGCFPIGESAVIKGTETIKVPYVTIKYLEYTPNINGAIIVEPNIFGTTLRCNKFRKDCVAGAIGVNALDDSIVNARLNWWGAPDGPSGGIMDDGEIADGLGVKVLGDVYVEPWIGIHAKIKGPDIPPPDPLNPSKPPAMEVEVGSPVTFDATGSWAYTYGECCQEPEELPLQYLWDFDDGKQSANMITTHIFDQVGTYLITLMVDSPGIPGLYSNFMYDWAYIIVHVVAEDTTLTCNADGGNLGGYETIVNEPLQLYGDAYGGNGEYNWYWNFGDQTTDSTEQNPVHIYIEPGTYTVTLTVISADETATDTTEVIVYDIDELFVNINDVNTVVGTETMFVASINGGTPPYIVSWDFGDGSTSQVTNPTHVYNNPGEYTIAVTVTDDKQKTATDIAVMIVEEKIIIEIAEIKDIKGGLGVQATIDAGSNNCNWIISVEGMVFFAGENSGTINANTQETVRLGFSLALGNVDIKVKAGNIQKEYTAFAVGPFYLNLKET